MSTEKLLEECRSLYYERKYPEAIDVCNEILKRDLNNQSAIGFKARCLYLIGRCEEALTLLENARILYPKNSYYLELKAEILMHYEDYGKAVECFREIFEMDISDEDTLDFYKWEYETCLHLRTDQLIEKEKYVDAWECYNELFEIKSLDFERSVRIREFKRIVRDFTSRTKSRQYHVKASSSEAKEKLVSFLDENGFKSSIDNGLLLLIDVVDKSYQSISVDDVGENSIISESKFYDKVNYYPRGEIEYKRIFNEDGKLSYEGYTRNNAPYGFGTAYFADGKVYREGIFDMKGIVQGREYYPSGRLRFEGQWSLTTGYGPNAPSNGNAYSEDGEMIYSGKFDIKRGGVGFPMIIKPKGFPKELKERPKIKYYKR